MKYFFARSRVNILQDPLHETSSTQTGSSIVSRLSPTTTLTSLSTTTSFTEPTYSKSCELNLLYSIHSHKLNSTPFDFKSYQCDEHLIELNSLDLSTLSKKERRKLRSRNPKYHMSWKLDNNNIKPKDFGYDWYKGYQNLVRNEWDRLSHMASNSKQK